MKLDSLVIAHQPWRGEYVPGPCTHRPSSHGSRRYLKSGVISRFRVKSVTGAKTLQGSRTGRCGWNTSFLDARIVIQYLHNIDERLVRVFSVVQPRLYENGKDVLMLEHLCKMIRVVRFIP